MKKIVQTTLLLLVSSNFAQASLYGDEFIMPSCKSSSIQNSKSTLLLPPPPREGIQNMYSTATGGGADDGDHKHEPFSLDWWIDMTVSFWCMTISGIMSGLTVGLASIDRLSLEIASK